MLVYILYTFCMQKYWHSFIKEVEAPRGLYASVLESTRLAKLHAARVSMILFSSMALISGAALVPAISYVLREFYASGFYDYLSLLISDHNVVFSSWQTFSLLLLESLPSLAILILLVCVVAFIWSASRVPRSVRSSFTPLQQT